MSKPVKYGGELDEAKESEREFFVTGTDAAKTLEPAEAVFDVVAPAIVTAMKRQRAASTLARGDAHADTQAAQPRGETIGIKPEWR